MSDQSKPDTALDLLRESRDAMDAWANYNGDMRWDLAKRIDAYIQRPQEARGTAASPAAALANDLLERVHAATGLDDNNVRIPVSRARWIIKALSDAENVARPSEPQGWQPIETAPRNGDVILLLATGPAMNRASTGHYSVEPYVTMQGEVVGAEEGFKGDGDQCIPSNQEVFTHWMQLPSAPVTKAEPHGN